MLERRRQTDREDERDDGEELERTKSNGRQRLFGDEERTLKKVNSREREAYLLFNRALRHCKTPHTLTVTASPSIHRPNLQLNKSTMVKRWILVTLHHSVIQNARIGS